MVDSNGSPVPVRSSSGPNRTTLGVGLGLGIPLAFALVGVGLWCCLRRRRRPRRIAPAQVVEPGKEVIGTSAIPRKAVPAQVAQVPSPLSQTTMAMSVSERMDVFPVPVSPRAPAPAPREHEVSSEALSRELPGQSRSPPPDYSQAPASQPMQVYGQGQRWEMG